MFLARILRKILSEMLIAVHFRGTTGFFLKNAGKMTLGREA